MPIQTLTQTIDDNVFFFFCERAQLELLDFLQDRAAYLGIGVATQSKKSTTSSTNTTTTPGENTVYYDHELMNVRNAIVDRRASFFKKKTTIAN